jgi:peptide chain release factor 2
MIKSSIISGGIFDITGKKERIAEIETMSTAPNFWNDNEKAQTVLKEMNQLKDWVQSWEKMDAQKQDIGLMLQMAEEEKDDHAASDVAVSLNGLSQGIEQLELRRMLGGEDDDKNAILTIHPGAGGTESQDWAEMLFRMYLRYAQRKGFSTTIMDLQAGDDAGIKSASIEIKGSYVYGYLKAEAGVHRLVRISPFDSNKRRHTSFASVFVFPEVEENIEIEINPNDLRIDTYRASGAGGQHVNKTSSAVRITHIPTNIVTQCQNERSQHQNKANAMKILAARLYQLKREEDAKKYEAIEKQKKDIAWGSQIRSYVFHPYSMVKDHRTNTEVGDVQGVMDGQIDEFIQAFLLEFGASK